MIANFGYKDGSGEYFLSIDTDKCNGCGDCVKACPALAIEMKDVMVDIDGKNAAAVREEHRKKLRYSCSSCFDGKKIFCMLACRQNAIILTYGK